MLRWAILLRAAIVAVGVAWMRMAVRVCFIVYFSVCFIVYFSVYFIVYSNVVVSIDKACCAMMVVTSLTYY